MPDELVVSVRRRDRLAIIQFSGDVTTFAEDVARDAYQQAVRDGEHNVALDFSTCEYINSAGVAVVIGLVTEARRQGRRVFAFGLSPHYQKIFRMVGLADYMELCDSEDDTVQRARPRVA
jgi:anti-anti-sigma factor